MLALSVFSVLLSILSIGCVIVLLRRPHVPPPVFDLGPVLGRLDALDRTFEKMERCLRDGHVAGAGLDVIPEEPPRDPLPGLLRAYRAGEDWLRGRLVITPHIAFHTPEAWDDIRRKGVETMRDVLVEGRRTNLVPPESD